MEKRITAAGFGLTYDITVDGNMTENEVDIATSYAHDGFAKGVKVGAAVTSLVVCSIAVVLYVYKRKLDKPAKAAKSVK